MKSITFTISLLFMVLGSAADSLIAGAAPTSLSVTVVGADNSDPRWRAADEAVEF
jgi:hypothetical protein